jgi:hypothetical protein
MIKFTASPRSLAFLPLCLSALACSSAPGATPAANGHEDSVTSSAPLTVIGPRSVSKDFLDLQYLPAGVSADSKVVFVGDPLEGRVLAVASVQVQDSNQQ